MNNSKYDKQLNTNDKRLNVDIKKKFTAVSMTIKNNELLEIHRCSKNSLMSELLFSIVVIEKMNRGNFSVQTLEKIMVNIFPSLVIKWDLSIGLCQIRISTAKQVSNITDIDLIKKLIDPLFSIQIMSKLIILFINNNNSFNILHIINNYTTGESNPDITKELVIYQNLVRWAIKENIFLNIYLHKNILLESK